MPPAGLPTGSPNARPGSSAASSPAPQPCWRPASRPTATGSAATTSGCWPRSSSGGLESQADLSRDTGIDRSDVTAALNELESRGYVERKVDPGHKRRNIVTLTPAGASALLRLDAVLEEIQEAVLAPLTAAQRRQFISLLSRLT